MSKSFLLSLIFTSLCSVVHADVILGKIAGGQLKAVEVQEVEDSEEGNSDSSGKFSLVWKKGKIKKTTKLLDYSEPSNTVDNYSIQSAKLEGNDITVVIARQGSYDYRGNSRYTYKLSFNPKNLNFSKAVETEETDRDVVEKDLRKFLGEKCDPTASLSKELEGSVTINPREASLLKQDEAYQIFFEEMHACSVKAFKEGNKSKAQQIVLQTLTTPGKGKDWICMADTADPETKCDSWKQVFLSKFALLNSAIAKDFADYLSLDKSTSKLADEIRLSNKSRK